MFVFVFVFVAICLIYFSYLERVRESGALVAV